MPILRELFPFKYSVGFNLNNIIDNNNNNNNIDIYKINLPFISYFKIDQYYFINNYNISIILIILPLFIMAITYLRYNKYKN